jgi:prepilin-type processing-associated H-X9-DG protein
MTSLSSTAPTAAANPNAGYLGAPSYMSVWKRNLVRAAADKIQFVDGYGNAINDGGSPPYTTRYFLAGYGENPNQSPAVCYRHSKGANCLYYDSHAEWRDHTELQVTSTAVTVPPNPNLRQWQPTVP